MKNKILIPVILIGSILLSPTELLAQDETFSASLGVFVTSRDSKARLDGQIPGSGTDVDLENDLGFNKSDSVFRFDGYFRFNDKHRLDFSVFDLSSNASKRIEREIEWDGTLYPIDTTIDSSLDLNIYKLAYTWSFLVRENGFLGLTGGLYVADIGTSISASALSLSNSNGLTAPLPVIGLRGQYDLNENWSLRSSLEIFAVDYNDFSGSLNDFYLGLDYQLTDHVALGVGYNIVNLNVGVDKTNFSGDLDWSYDGGLVFLKLDF